MAEVLQKQIPEIEKVTLEPGSGGVFEISIDAKLIFSKKKLRRFPEEKEAVRLVRQHAEAADNIN